MGRLKPLFSFNDGAAWPSGVTLALVYWGSLWLP